MNVPRFLAARLLTGAIVLWGAATLTFVMMHLTSGDTAVAILGGPDAMPTAEQIAAVRAEYGLDRPFIVQYGDWLWRLLHGDLGQSYRLRIPVSEAIADQLWPTVQLGLTSAALAFVLAILSATLTVRRKRTWIGKLASINELVFVAVPVFVVGIALLLIFAFYFPILPVANATGIAGLVLPAITLALPMAATLAQVLRQELEDVLEQPFILTARARGLSDLATRFRHALRHALMPVITLSGFFLAALMSSTAVTESLFSRPGVGRLLVDASNTTDVPVVVGITILSALFYVIASVAVDLFGAVVDPRMVAR